MRRGGVVRWLLAGLAAVTLLLATGCDAGYRVGSVRPVGAEALWMVNSDGEVLALNGRTGRAFAYVNLGVKGYGWRLAGDADVVWAVLGDGRLVRVDPRRARVTARLQLPSAPASSTFELTFAHGALWVNRHTSLWRVGAGDAVAQVVLPAGVALRTVVDDGRGILAGASDGRLVRIDPTGSDVTVLGTSSTLKQANRIAVTPDGVLVAGPDGVAVLDPDTAATRWTVPVARAGDMDLAVDGAVAWLAGYQGADDGGLIRTAVAVRHPAPAAVSLGDMEPSRPVVAGGALWLGDNLNVKLLRVDPGATAPTAVELPLDADEYEEFADLAFVLLPGRDSVWALDVGDGHAAFRVDLSTNAVTRLPTPNLLFLEDVIVVSGTPT